MSTWMLIWKTVLILALCGFAVMAVVVSILGFRDIKRLFDRLSRSEDKDED